LQAQIALWWGKGKNMKTSEFSCTEEAISKAVETSQSEDRVVTLWIDDTTIDEVLSVLSVLESGAQHNDHELIEDNHVDAWGDDWRVVIRVLA
jgi:hypothetical protein